MKVLACIFDLDGVIVDTARYHYFAWKRLAEELGFYFSEKHNERLKGVSRMTSLNILLETGGIKLPEENKLQLAGKKNSWYKKYISKLSPDDILPGAKEYLTEVKKSNLKIGIGSASKNTHIILRNIGLDKFFDSVVDGNKIHKAKPDPEVFLNVANELNIPPGNCVVFEDAVAGIQAARNGGMTCVGIGSDKILHEADLVVKSLKEMTLEKLYSL
ncbi:MAG: beta-phosphoglucomutase [Bacteroidales bacterium]|nr:beta-phosphoglucomutase [Bacteroidales bacterium]